MKKFVIPLLTIAIVVSIIFGGCVPGRAPEVTRVKPEKASDVPELQGIIAMGCLDPNILMNPFGEDFAIKPDGTPYRIADVTVFLYCDWNFQGCAYMDSMIRRAGAIPTLYDPNFVLDRQIAMVEDITATKSADAMLIQPVEEYGIVPCLELAADAGIAVFVVTTGAYTDKVISYSRHDYAGAHIPGYGCDVVGQWYVDYVERTGELVHVYELWGTRGMETSRLRHEGFHRGIANHPLITVTESPDTAWATEIMGGFLMDAMTADPTINATFQHGGGTSGLIEAVRTLGRLYPIGDPNHVIIATNEDDTEIVDVMDEGFIDAFCTNSPMCQHSIAVCNVFNYLVLGQSVPKENWMPMQVITPENTRTQREFGLPAAWARLPRGTWDLWPVADVSEVGITIPTTALRKQLMGY